MAVKSVLPPEMEAKRKTIAKFNNRMVYAVLAGFFTYAFSMVSICGWLLPPAFFQNLSLIGILIGVVIVFYALFRVSRYQQQLCRKLGFLCPHCHEPLYDPKGFINVTGRCPACDESVI